MPLGKEVGLGPGHIVLDGDPVGTQPPHSSPSALFGPCLLWPNGCPSQQLLSSCWFCFHCTNQEIGWEEHIQNDVFCVEWDVKRKALTQSISCGNSVRLPDSGTGDLWQNGWSYGHTFSPPGKAIPLIFSHQIAWISSDRVALSGSTSNRCSRKTCSFLVHIIISQKLVQENNLVTREC